MGRKEGYTTMQIKKMTLALFNEFKAREAGQRGESNLEQDEFLKFLICVYELIQNDTPVLTAARKKASK